MPCNKIGSEVELHHGPPKISLLITNYYISPMEPQEYYIGPQSLCGPQLRTTGIGTRKEFH